MIAIAGATANANKNMLIDCEIENKNYFQTSRVHFSMASFFSPEERVAAILTERLYFYQSNQ
jgi:hypothetical protein